MIHIPEQLMRLYCTRPSGGEPHINNIEEKHLTHGSTPQRYCSTCGMPLILKNQYLPLQEFPGGGFGRTFVVLDLNSPGEVLSQKRRRIVKQLHPRTSLTPERITIVEKKFREEAEVLEELKHPQIPQLYAFFELSVPKYFPNSQEPSLEEEKLFYLVQEYIQGDDLSQELQKRRDTETNFFTEAEVTQILVEILDILKFIHSHPKQIIIHRDIKPSNIIRHQQTRRLYLIDFGAVKQVVQQIKNIEDSTEIIFYTRGFSPPEQVAGRGVSFASDLYSLAATCINLLTGENPSNLEIPYDLNSWQSRVKIKPALATILNKMLAPDAKNRYQSADEVIEAITALKQRGWSRLHFWLLALGGVGIVSAFTFWLYQIFLQPLPPAPLPASHFTRGEKSLTKQVADSECQPAYQAKAAGMKAFGEKNIK
jgi:serine/threonine protein kinase